MVGWTHTSRYEKRRQNWRCSYQNVYLLIQSGNCGQSSFPYRLSPTARMVRRVKREDIANYQASRQRPLGYCSVAKAAERLDSHRPGRLTGLSRHIEAACATIKRHRLSLGRERFSRLGWSGISRPRRGNIAAWST